MFARPLIILLIVLGVAVLGYAIYVTISIRLAVHESKELFKKTTPYEQHPEGATMRILVAGDSTAVGTGAESSDLSTAGRLGQHYPQADLSNVSKNGMKIEELRERILALPDTHFNLVQIQIGGNDVIGLTPLSKVRENLDTILTWADTHSDRTIVITAGNIGLSPVFNGPLGWIITGRTLQVRKVFMEEVAKHNSASYVDLFKNRRDETMNTDVKRYYAPDRFHPSGEGYGLWFEHISPLLP